MSNQTFPVLNAIFETNQEKTSRFSREVHVCYGME